MRDINQWLQNLSTKWNGGFWGSNDFGLLGFKGLRHCAAQLGGKLQFPPHFRFRAQSFNSSPIKLKIELCTYQSHPDTTRKNNLHRTCSWTPLERFLTIGDQNGAKVGSEIFRNYKQPDISKDTCPEHPIWRGIVLLVCSTYISVFGATPNCVCGNLFFAEKNLRRTW